jgi:WD40 repeat protein
MLRIRRWMLLSLFSSGVAVSLASCEKIRSTGTGGKADPVGTPAVQVEPGPPIYPAAPMPKMAQPTSVVEPIVVPNAVVQYDVRVQVPASVDAMIELIATPLPPGTKFNPNDPEILFHPRDEAKTQPYIRLREDAIVRKDQIIARLDEQLVSLQKMANEALIKEHDRSKVESLKAAAAYEEQLNVLKMNPNTPRFEILGLVATVARLKADVIQTERERVKTEGDLHTAEAQLARYWIYSPINGRIIKILKNPREFAKAGEVVMEIQGIDRIRVEGKMPLEYANSVKKGMRVVVEPARPLGPNPVSNYHRQEVTAIAVTAHKDKDGKGRPMVVSGGLDASALVWDVTKTKLSHRLPHPVGQAVRTVSTTGTATKVGHLVATGCDDGIVRLWEVNTPDKLPTTPMHAFDSKDDRHTSGVLASAFSPDGRFLATSAGREVTIWDVVAKKKKYSLPVEHKDAITALRFTPQATLITMSRDKSLRIWQVGEQAAVTKSIIDHRGGSVDVLGVSSDGSQVLFDKDSSRLDLVSLSDERTVGTLQSPGSSRFTTFAIFSNDDKLIITGGGESDKRGEMTVWETPQAGGRGAERRRLLTPKSATVTCAAFSPDSTERFVAVGTSEGGVHFWTAPSAEELGKATTGEVVAVLPADARSVTVRVELANPIDKPSEMLQDRSLATIIIDPSATVPPPVAGIVPAVTQANPNSDIRTVGAVETPGVVIPAGANRPGTLPPAANPPKMIPPLQNPPMAPKMPMQNPPEPQKLPMLTVPSVPR